MNIRSNASIQAVARAAHLQADKLNQEYHAASKHADDCFPNNWHEKCRASDAWRHHKDILDLAEHLTRLAGNNSH